MKYLISIGVNNVEGLIPLEAAVSGAKDFAEWGKSQNYETFLFTDENAVVTSAAIFKQINAIVKRGDCEKLILFFAGHGLLRGTRQEVLLLSDAKENSNESINLLGSIEAARLCGIPYLVFISDACRMLPSEIQFTGNGSIIFPNGEDVDVDCALDVLYATRPGNPAYEQSGDSNLKKFGLFTETLLEILRGDYPELIISNAIPSEQLSKYYDVDKLSEDISYKTFLDGNWQVSTISSESTIKTIVNNKARSISIAIKQNPEITIQHQTNKPGLSEFDDPTAKKLLLKNSTIIKKKKPSEYVILDCVQEIIQNYTVDDFEKYTSFKSILQDANEKNSIDFYQTKSNLVSNSELIYDSNVLQDSQISTGFTIIGVEIKDVFANCKFEIYTEKSRTHIKIKNFKASETILLVLKNGHSIPLAILKDFIGIVIFKKNSLLTVNYTPSINSYKYKSFKKQESEINFVRSFVASAANEGFDYGKTFEKEIDDYFVNHYYGNPGSFLRQEKSLDPSLSLYASYAYIQAGKYKDIKSIFDHMQRSDLIFDVVMLAGQIDKIKRLTPFCPMISLGWAYSNKFNHTLRPEVLEASKTLIPSLWTTFDTSGTEILKEIFNEKK
ncbi:caspase family protein [Chryseobacterium sp.]|uniref:caspase family protein n=1 Tax=Chryseobacterium sp. TaxID=1871047 RepID=UPI0031DBDC03